jgi:symplekin
VSLAYGQIHLITDIQMPDKKTRAAAINVVKAWVPNVQPMDSMIRDFALQMLRKLQYKSVDRRLRQRKEDKEMTHVTVEDISLPQEKDAVIEEQDHDQVEEKSSATLDSGKAQDDQGETAENGQVPDDDLVQTAYLPERIELPAQKAQVLQHVELLFALSVKVPEFLEA